MSSSVSSHQSNLGDPSTSYPSEKPGQLPSYHTTEFIKESDRKRQGRGRSFIKVVAGLLFLGWLGSQNNANIWGWTKDISFLGNRRHVFKVDGEGVNWKPCVDNPAVLCATLEVPTDYDDLSVGITYLAMSKIPAKVPKKDRKGSIMVNYGGPGVPGRSAAFTFGTVIADLAPSYDIISWDPRGIGRTVPAVNCHGTAEKAVLAKAGTTHESTFEIPPDPFSEAGTAVLVFQQREALGIMQMQGELCEAVQGAEVLKYFGTTTLILDTNRISSVLEGKDALINGWSGSYGTIWTAYLVNMFPEKVGRVATYGVADPPLWANAHYETYELLRNLLQDAEVGYEWFLTDCFNAGPDRCALTQEGDKSFKDVKNRIGDFIDKLYKEPMHVWDAERPGLIKSGHVRSSLFLAIQFVADWSAYANIFASAISGNGTALRNLVSRTLSSEPQADGFVDPFQPDLQRLGVSCADAPPYKQGEPLPDAEVMVKALQGILRDVSPTFGATVNLLEQHGGCQFWPQSPNPVPRFTGPWNSTLANTILVASNSHDPITSAALGREMANLFGEQARHVISHAPGHSYLTKPRGEFAAMLTAFYEDGVIPKEKETVYENDVNYFLLESKGGNFLGMNSINSFSI